MQKKARIIAFYLPQFHPIPENDEWWGKGFTEWTNVGKAKKLFRGHYQPRVPADLGYYDLRVPETRQAQADMAREVGIEGFCYWHYWFGNGKRLLERPFNEVLSSGKPDFPFCLAWANETWKGFAHGLRNRNVLIEQKYFGEKDYRAHFFELLPAFKDKRYIQVDGKPLFIIYKPFNFLDMAMFIQLWQQLARENGLAGIHFVGVANEVSQINHVLQQGFDAVSLNRFTDYLKYGRSLYRKIIEKLLVKLLHYPRTYDYEKATKFWNGEENKLKNVYPTIFSNWDHTPRSGNEGIVLTNSTPKKFEKHFVSILRDVENKKDDNKIIFLKSWNEWAEGNYVEPDLKWGHQYLNIFKKYLK